MKEVTCTRIVLNTNEKAIRKQWKYSWKKIWELHKKGKPITIEIGEWSGYTSSQQQVCHCILVTESHPDLTIKFSDNTYLYVKYVEYTLEEFFIQELKRINNYSRIIKETLDSGSNYYEV